MTQMHDFRPRAQFSEAFPLAVTPASKVIFVAPHWKSENEYVTGKASGHSPQISPVSLIRTPIFSLHPDADQQDVPRSYSRRDSDPDLLTSSKHTSERQDGRSHRARLFSGNTGLTDLITVQLQCMATSRGLYSHRPQDCFSISNTSAIRGTVVKHRYPSLMQHCSRHHWQGSILRSLNLYFSLPAPFPRIHISLTRLLPHALLSYSVQHGNIW